MQAPETRYTLSGDVNIAYQVVGDGPLDLVFIPSLTHHVELVWENPPQARFFGRLASIGRLLLFDKRGTGMSDRVVGTPPLEVRMDDIRAVMDAAGSERAVLCGLGDGGPLCALFAATYPERTTALVLINTAPRTFAARSFPGCPRVPSGSERLTGPSTPGAIPRPAPSDLRLARRAQRRRNVGASRG
jgi:pimeloyl-ACP methyl ester carboxylesterase